MRRRSLLAVIGLLLAFTACTDSSESRTPIPTAEVKNDTPTFSFELDCDEYASETAALVEDFQASPSPEDAVLAIDTFRLPAGDWHELDGSRWVHVDGQGNTVARTTIEPVTQNAVEVFPETRYLTGVFEYCR